MKITAKTKVTEALKSSKKIVEIFNNYNLDCPGCKGASQDTIEKTAQNNGLELKTFLDELNKAQQ